MSPTLSKIVGSALSFPTVWYREGQFKKIRMEGVKSTIISRTAKGHLFFTGLTPRVLQEAHRHGISVDYDPPEKFLTPGPIKLPEGMDLRNFQSDLIQKLHAKERGILKAPTGTGKTVLGLSVIASIQDVDQILWLCHTKDLLYQTYEEGLKFFGKNKVGVIGDGRKEDCRYLTVATRQSFKNLADDLGTSYDILIVDEAHHVTSFKGEYADILQKIYAPIRIGLTATLPVDLEAKLALEAFIGPLVGEFSVNEGIKQGFMSKPIIKISKIPKLQRIRDLRKYADVYEKGIVRRLDRNKVIVDLIKEYTKQDMTCLIVVNQIEHGELLMSMCRHCGLDTVFVHGSTESDDRMAAKVALNENHIRSVICTTVWKEGISIPELNVVINAAGGKSEIATLQSIGRGTRATSTKKEVIIHDFFDPSHPFLLDHFGERFCIYADNGWI
jgi:superfamily II DNA or RNA helicase